MGTFVKVKDGEPFESALRRFKKIMEKTGVLTELRKREHYEKPCEKRKRKKMAAIKRQQRTARGDSSSSSSSRSSSSSSSGPRR